MSLLDRIITAFVALYIFLFMGLIFTVEDGTDEVVEGWTGVNIGLALIMAAPFAFVSALKGEFDSEVEEPRYNRVVN